MGSPKLKSSFGLVVIILIALYGLFLRVDRFAVREWNTDEVFELRLFGESGFFLGDLDLPALRQELKGGREQDVLVLQKLNTSVDKLDQVSEQEFVAAFNALLDMQDFYIFSLEAKDVGSLPAHAQLLYRKIKANDNPSRQDYMRLNMAILQSSYSQATRASHGGSWRLIPRHKALVTSGDHTSFPGEYLVTRPVIQFFGNNRWGLVFPRIIFSILGFYFLYLLCASRFQTIWGPVIAFLFYSLNNELIYHAVELRPYSVLPTLALGAFYFSERIVRQYDQMQWLEKGLVGLFFIVGMSYHAFGIVIFLLPLFYVVLEQNGFKIVKVWQKNYFRFLFPACVLAVLIWAWYAAPDKWGMHAEMKNNSFGDPFRFWPSPFVAPLAFAKTMVGNLVGYCKPLYFLLIGMAAFFIPQPDRLKQWFFFLLLIFFPIALIFVSDLSTGYWFVQRQFVWVMPFFAFLVGWQWDSLVYLWGNRK